MPKYFSVTASINNSSIDAENLDILDCFISVVEDAGLSCAGSINHGRMEYFVMENTKTMASWVKLSKPGTNLANGKEALRKYMEDCGDFYNVEIGGIIE